MCPPDISERFAMANDNVLNWNIERVSQWLKEKGFNGTSDLFRSHSIDGKALLLMNETDLRTPPLNLTVSLLKRIHLSIKEISIYFVLLLLFIYFYTEFGYSEKTWFRNKTIESRIQTSACGTGL
jgi:hypothetical protein